MLRVRHRDHQEHGLSVSLLVALAVFAAGCDGADEDLGVGRQADSSTPIVGRSTPVATPGLAPLGVLPTLTSRGSDFLAAWSTLSVDGGAILATRFGVDGKPKTPAGTPLATFENVDFTPQIGAVACAPKGDCIVVNLHAASRNRLRTGVSTLRADGTILNDDDVVPAHAGMNGIAAGFDGQSFVLAWATPKVETLRFANGAAIGTPSLIDAGSGVLDGLACAPDSGCFLMFQDASGMTRVAVATQGGDFALASPTISETSLQAPVGGGGIYVVLSPTAAGYDALRFGADGLPLDPSVVAIPPPPGNPVRRAGLGFDGTRFLAVLNSQEDSDGQLVRKLQATPLAIDGTLSTPVDLSAYAKHAVLTSPIACGDGTCEIPILGQTTATTQTIAVTGNDVAPHDASLAYGPAQQVPASAIKVGGRVLATWNENAEAHGRWFDDQGDPKGDAFVIDSKATIVAADSVDDDGLLLLHGSDGARTTRLVDANGKIHAAIALTSPHRGAGAKPARFMISEPLGNDGRHRLRRFDAAGNALEDQRTTISAKQQPESQPMSAAHAGDLFVILFSGGNDSQVQIARARANGELIGVAPVDPQGGASTFFDLGGGIACTAEQCVAIWNQTRGPIEFGTDGSEPAVNGLVGARFDPRSPWFAPALIDARGSQATITFDGESFVAAFNNGNGLNVARLDVEGAAVATPIGLGFAAFLVPFAPRKSLLFSLDSDLRTPTAEFAVRKVSDGADPLSHLVPDPTTSSLSESDPKCSAAPPGRGAPSGSLFVLAAALSARLLRPSARRRRRRSTSADTL